MAFLQRLTNHDLMQTNNFESVIETNKYGPTHILQICAPSLPAAAATNCSPSPKQPPTPNQKKKEETQQKSLNEKLIIVVRVTS